MNRESSSLSPPTFIRGPHSIDSEPITGYEALKDVKGCEDCWLCFGVVYGW